MTTTCPEAFLLLTLEDVTIRTNNTIQTGSLGLECVTVPLLDGERDVFLLIKLNDLEIPIEHTRKIILDTSSRTTRIYTLYPTETDPTTIILDIPTSWHPSLIEDIETFDGVLGQYTHFSHDVAEEPIPAYVNQVSDKSRPLSEYRGQLVLVNEDNGEVVGEFDRKVNVQEDPALQQRGHEKDPVLIEVPPDSDEEHPLEFFARAIPPEQQDWMTTSATVVSHGITAGTSLFISVLSGASNLYIKRSAPSPYHTSNTAIPSASAKPPPRALVLLTSERTRQNLTTAHTYTGKAVKVSGKTLEIIGGIIKKTVGSDKKPDGSDKGKGRATTAPAAIDYDQRYSPVPYPAYKQQEQNSANGYPQIPAKNPISRSPSPVPSYGRTILPNGAPPPYSGSGYLTPDAKPPLPPRITPSSSRNPSPSRSPNIESPQALTPPVLPPRKISTTKRVLLSVDLILSTLDVSTKRVLDAGSQNVGAVMRHKYGKEAGHSSEMMVGAARNVALVYVDVKGMGRKAILKSATKEFVKAKVGKK